MSKTLIASFALLASFALDAYLLSPLLVERRPDLSATLRAYFEPEPDGIEILFDRANHGYVTEYQVDETGGLSVPAGRTLALVLEQGVDVTVRTQSERRAPYLIVGTAAEPDEVGSATKLLTPSVPRTKAGGLELAAWAPTLPWNFERAWLSGLRSRCGSAEASEAVLRSSAAAVSVSVGSCVAEMPRETEASDAFERPMLVVLAGPDPVSVSLSSGAWPHVTKMRWPLLALVIAKVSVLAWVFGVGPTVFVGLLLVAVGQFLWAEAILVWAVALPIWIAAAVGSLFGRTLKLGQVRGWAIGAAVLLLEVAVAFFLIVKLDIGSFGNERITRGGDDTCSVIGYSTVRGDTLRGMSGGIVERLNEDCRRCRGRTSRFSREAQTLRWVRETVCAPDFSIGGGGELIFVGGANDDLFYRPTKTARLVSRLLGALHAMLDPARVTQWEAVFERANVFAVSTLDEQVADIAAIADCARAHGKQFRFVHDFLVWDLDDGRSAARETTFSARKAAAQGAGVEFIDLLEEFGPRAGMSWLNDFIHPSAVGHRMVADRLCSTGAEQ